MQAKLYIKPNVIGLAFVSTQERESFWAMLGSDQAAAEKFGDRSIRFNPTKAARAFSLKANVDVTSKEITVPVAKPVISRSTPVPVVHAPNGINAADIRPPAPIAPVAVIPRGELENTPMAAQAPPPPITNPQPTVVIPQISSVVNSPAAAVAPDPEPADKRTKAHKEWMKRNAKA